MQKRILNDASRLMFTLLALVIIVNVYSPLMVNASSDITIEGRLTVHHMGQPGGDIIPIKNALIKVYDEEIIQYPIIGWGHLPWPDELLGTTYTDSDGYFAFTVNNDDGNTIIGDEKGRDIYIKVVASNRAATVRNNPDWMFGVVFEHKMGTYADLEDGTDKYITIRPDTPDYQIAFEILHNIDKARDFVITETGITPEKINVFYKDDFHNDVFMSYYLPNTIGDYLATVPTPTLPTEYFPPELINLLLPLAWDGISPVETDLIQSVTGIHYDDDILIDSTRYYEVIYHEYGHHVMSELFELGPPFPYEGTHYIDEEYHPMHSWVEGWAEFFSAAAREYVGISDYLTFGGYRNIESLEYDYEGEDKDWDSVEGNIAGILWDMYDTHNEYSDKMSLSFNELVSLIRSYDPIPAIPGDARTWPLWADHPWTIYHIFDAFRPYYNYDRLTSKAWNIITNSGIDIPDPDPPMNPISYTSTHNGIIPLNQMVIQVDIQGAFDTISGVKGYYYMWHHGGLPNINDPNDSIDYETYWEYQSSIHFEKDTSLLQEGDWYLYLVTLDYAGNYAEQVFEAGPFKTQEINNLQIEGIFTTNIGEIYGNSFTEVTVPTLEYPTKTYEATIFQIFTPEIIQDPIEFTGSTFDFTGKSDGMYQMEIIGIDGELADELYNLSIKIDNTDPEVWIHVGEPKFIQGQTYVTRDTSLTITAEDTGSGIKSIEYSFNNMDWLPYSGSFQLPSLGEGVHTVYARAVDNLDNTAYTELMVVLDNTSPDQWVIIGNPKKISESTIITSTTPLTIFAEDMGCGLDSIMYKVYSMEEPETWIPYNDTFSLPPIDGEYTIGYQAIDNLGNTATDTIMVTNDNTGPSLQILSPTNMVALQDIVEYRIDAVDPSGVVSVTISIRSLDDPSTSLGFDDMIATFNSDIWVLEFNNWNLIDGEYLVIISSSDSLGNFADLQSQYSIRNWALIELLPATPNHKAGRTLPIKFTIHVAPQVDPLEPFVYNEDLIICISAGENILQESRFGETSTDYRIDTETQQYITNFKTSKIKQEYTVEILRTNFLVDSFTFSTSR